MPPTPDNLVPIAAPAAVPVPGLPPLDEAAKLKLGRAVRAGLVPADPGVRLNAAQVLRWAKWGCMLAAGGPRYRFPAVRLRSGWFTTPAWCAIWGEWVRRVRAEAVRGQLVAWERGRG